MNGNGDILGRLQVFEELRQLKASYFRCMDGRDWEGLREVFTDDAVFDMRDEVAALRASGYDLPEDAGLVTGREAIVASMVRGTAGIVSVHLGHMPELTIDTADTASGTWALEDIMRMPEDSAVAEIRGYGRYHENYVRSDGRWRIAHLTFTRTLRYVQMKDGTTSVYAALPR